MSERRVSDEELISEYLEPWAHVRDDSASDGLRLARDLRDSLALETALRAEIVTKDAALAEAEEEASKQRMAWNERHNLAVEWKNKHAVEKQRADKAEAALAEAVTANAEAERRSDYIKERRRYWHHEACRENARADTLAAQLAEARERNAVMQSALCELDSAADELYFAADSFDPDNVKTQAALKRWAAASCRAARLAPPDTSSPSTHCPDVSRERGSVDTTEVDRG